MNMSPKILIVDDEPSLINSLNRALQLEGYQIIKSSTGEEALNIIKEGNIDAVILDVGLPDITGLQVCERMRKQKNKTPVLMLTARDAIDDRVAGLDAGADDYLVKPFSLKELQARLRALLRRNEDKRPSIKLEYKDLTLHSDTHDVFRGDRKIDLSRTEFLLLELFMRNPERILSRTEIFEQVWGYDFGSSSNTLGVYIGYLRRKLEENNETILIHTVRGVGYILREE